MPFLLKNDAAITPELICKYIKLHRELLCDRYKMLEDYYNGEHPILKRLPKREGDPCNNLVANFPAYIADMASGYHIGEPVSYQSESEDLTDLLELYKNAQVDVQDTENSGDQAIFGVAYELVYMSSDKEPEPRTANVPPSQAFVIYNDTVEFKSICGVYYTQTCDQSAQTVNGYDVVASTAERYIRFRVNKDYNIEGDIDEDINPFGAVTLIEIYNNKYKKSDFEKVLSLIDGYNKEQSVRVDDKEEFINSLMVLKGQVLGDTDDEKDETYRSMKERGVAELSPDGDLSFLTRQTDSQGDDLLRTSIAEDIHKFSYVPSFTDKDFGGNISGIAMQFKLFGLNQLMKKKDRYTVEGLRERMKLFNAILKVQGKKPINVNNVKITITHSSPKNLQELAQIIGVLTGICSNETLAAQLPFVEDPEKEVKKAAEERRQQMDEQFVMSTAAVTQNNDAE
jgi:SPP1 family phage portal protein